MNKRDLRSEFDELVSDMLLMQYRVEVFRRRMQSENGLVGNHVTCRLSDLLDESIDELLGLQGDHALRAVPKKKWWER
jgi:hypothetical protein